MKMDQYFSRVLHVDLDAGKSEALMIEDRHKHLGGSGLAAVLYERYGLLMLLRKTLASRWSLQSALLPVSTPL